MLSWPATVRVFLAARPTDMRRSFDGLAEQVRQFLKADPLSGHLFVFRNKKGDRLKLLFWDEDGYVLVYKRLEVGGFHFPTAVEGHGRVEVRAADLLMLFDGVDLESVQRRPRYRRPAPAATPTPS